MKNLAKKSVILCNLSFWIEVHFYLYLKNQLANLLLLYLFWKLFLKSFKWGIIDSCTYNTFDAILEKPSLIFYESVFTNENTNENKQENKNENTNSNSGRKRRDVVGSSKAFCNFSISSNFLVIYLAHDPQVHMILSYAVWMYSLGSSSTSTVFGGTSVNNAINQNRRKRMLFPSNFLGKRTKRI